MYTNFEKNKNKSPKFVNTQNIEQMYYLYKWVSNSNNGKPHRKILGYAKNIVTAIATKIFYANCLNACDTPTITFGPFPTGTLYKIAVTPGMAAIGFPVGGFVALIQ